jgi:hypothetical protein
MKLMRVGPAGRETPALLDVTGRELIAVEAGVTDDAAVRAAVEAAATRAATYGDITSATDQLTRTLSRQERDMVFRGTAGRFHRIE